MSWEVIQGDCLDVMRSMPDNSVDSVCTDPPAGISFMSREWDSDRGGRDAWIAWLSEVLTECNRVMKPGAHALVWAIPRTSHWTGMAIENAGLNVRDVITHLQGAGFPKSRRVDMDERFCHCDANGHTSSYTYHEPSLDDHRHKQVDVSDGVSPLLGGHHLNGTPSSFQVGYHQDHGLCDGLAHSQKEDDLASVQQQECALAHNHSGEHEGVQHSESSHSLYPAQYNDRPSSLDYLDHESSRYDRSSDILENTMASENSSTQMDSATSVHHISNTASESSAFGAAFPYNCTSCGKPIAKGFGTALKPSAEFWFLARKPLSEKSIAANVLAHGTGAINVDATRVQTKDDLSGGTYGGVFSASRNPDGTLPKAIGSGDKGRWPPNTLLDTSAAAALDAQSGVRKAGGKVLGSEPSRTGQNGIYGIWERVENQPYADTGGASRFFPVFEPEYDVPFRYVAKASRAERQAGVSNNAHPT